jgi:Protein of unknown function (DUF3300)
MTLSGKRVTLWTWLCAALMLVSGAANAQSPPQTFKPEEIEALVAPIALYPDSLLSQVLMASTYPLEVVYAARWVKANPNVKGDAAVKAVANEPWDVSVKSLVAFPQVLEPMSDKLDWTQKLGDAFLAQEKDVLDAVQRLRARAHEAGNLKSNEQQKVTVEPLPQNAQAAPPAGQTAQTIVRIEPADPQVIYVPAYNPTVVYGAWSYPAYPPTYWPPPPAYYPGGALVSGFAWGVGLAAAGALFSDCNWGHGDVNVNVNKAANIDRNFDRSKVQGGKWQHNAAHRQGVAYRDNASREKYAKNVGGAQARNNFRGREGGGVDRAGVADRNGGANRAAVADRGATSNRAGTADRGGGNRAGTADRGGVGNRSQTASPAGGGGSGRRAGGGSSGRDNAFQGVGAGNASQRSFDRGQASMRSSSFSGPSGGARAGGGGARAGGGGRGGRR